jgi:hypothetical protein
MTYKHNSTVNDKLWVFTSTKSLDPFKLNYNIQDIIVKYDLSITFLIIAYLDLMREIQKIIIDSVKVNA